MIGAGTRIYRMRYLMIAIFAMALFHTGASAQKKYTAEHAAAGFYRWYIAEMNARRFPIDMNRNMLLDKISARLGEWLYSDAYVYDGRDVFLDAHDWDDSWARGVTAVTLQAAGDAAEVKVTLRAAKGSKSGLGMHVLHVKMVKEGGIWRVDRAENRKWTSEATR